MRTIWNFVAGASGAWLAVILVPALWSPPALAGSPEQPDCGAGARLDGQLYGAIDATLAWHAAELECDGMPRPHGEGARLRFAGPVEVDGVTRQLAIIVALPDLRRGATGRELPATVTVIEEDAGHFYSTREQEICWSDIASQTPDGDNSTHYSIAGIVYCVAPLAALNDAGSITLGELKFAGRVNWQVPE